MAENSKKSVVDTYIRDAEVHKTIFLAETENYAHVTEPGFFFDTEYERYCGQSHRPYMVDTKESLAHYGFYVDKSKIGHGIGEWGFTFTCLKAGNSMGDGRTLLPDVQFGLRAPVDRRDALGLIKDWIFKQFDYEIQKGNWNSMNGYNLWDHYACEWGATLIGHEAGESIGHSQADMAFVRGAGRQYGLPTFINFSEWYGSMAHAHSDSLCLRHAMATLMGGFSFYVVEGGAFGLLEPQRDEHGQPVRPTADRSIHAFPPKGEDGFYPISKTGLAYKRAVDFHREYPDTGIAYTPFAIVLDYYHGMKANDDFRAVFGRFAYEKPDWMSYNLLGQFFPGGWGGQSAYETSYLVNGPYGDTCDVLLQNASQRVLNSYPCVIPSGDIQFSTEEVERYIAYVEQGGTLILNTAYLRFFPTYAAQYSGDGAGEFAYGKGTVIIYGPDFEIEALDGIIRKQLLRLVPFTFSHEISYLIKVKEDTLYLTLINNDGVYKTQTSREFIDKRRAMDVTVTYTGEQALAGVQEIFEKSPLTVDGNEVTVHMEPGGIKVIEFTLH